MPSTAFLKEDSGCAFQLFSTFPAVTLIFSDKHICSDGNGRQNTLENISSDGFFGKAATAYIGAVITVSTVLSGVVAVLHGKSHFNLKSHTFRGIMKMQKCAVSSCSS